MKYRIIKEEGYYYGQRALPFINIWSTADESTRYWWGTATHYKKPKWGAFNTPERAMKNLVRMLRPRKIRKYTVVNLWNSKKAFLDENTGSV